MADRQKVRYNSLRTAHFTPLEARELSILPKETPALKLVVETRLQRRGRFEKAAARRISTGVWQREDVPGKWLANLARMYTRSRWRVQEGPRGKQAAMPKGGPNPWAMYRSAEKIAPTKGYVSPWQIRQIRKGKTKLEKGLIFIQKAERAGGASFGQLRLWITQKDRAISKAKGQRKEQLLIERGRLERLLQT